MQVSGQGSGAAQSGRRFALASDGTEISAPLPIKLVDKAVFEGKPRIPLEDAVRWALDTLCMAGIGPRDAPSAAAWSLREWARSSRRASTDFFRVYVCGVLSPRDSAKKTYMEGMGSGGQSEIGRLLGPDPDGEDGPVVYGRAAG